MTSMPDEVDAPVDVAALTMLLDGRYKQVRDLARENLVQHRAILGDAETLSTQEYRERVKEIVVALAGTGQTGYGFPREYGGGVTWAPRWPPSRPPRSVTCR